MTITDPATLVGPASLRKSWTWRPGPEVLPFECAEDQADQFKLYRI